MPGQTGAVAAVPSDAAAPSEAPGAVAAATGEAAPAAETPAGAGTATAVDTPATGAAATGVAAADSAPGIAPVGPTPGDKDVAAAPSSPEASSDRTSPAAASAEADAAPGEAPAAVAAVEEPKVEPEVAVTAVEAETGGTLYIAGVAKTPETVRVYIDDKLVGDATPSPSGTWLLEVKRDLPAGQYAVRADQIDRAGAVIVRAEVPFERELEVASLRPVAEAGGSGAGATVSGAMPALQTVIIKRGDNLWRISRSMYGKGVRYSTIYQANRDQIRNARWIYPGQVFVVPTGDTSWQD
ncbi:MAG TPA: LysM peptidoglycan-binding domain-containing protein [Bauldia sp.]|nr:LysM peptidoglycan-binding domain-containing protein [Bauldia sp.]